MTKKQALALKPGDKVATNVGRKRIDCIVLQTPRLYGNSSGFESVVVSLRSPAGNTLERHNREIH